MSGSLIVQRPASRADLLVLLFHGVGGSAGDLVPLGSHLAAALPNALIVSVEGPDASDLASGSGRQWFSARGITQANRPERVQAAMPRFLAAIGHWQAESGIDPSRTVLVGFSQGAILALESTRQRELTAGRIVAIAGRFAQLPERAAPGVSLNLIHGKRDGVIAYDNAVAACERLCALGDAVTLDLLEAAGHEINAAITALVLERIRNGAVSLGTS